MSIVLYCVLVVAFAEAGSHVCYSLSAAISLESQRRSEGGELDHGSASLSDLTFLAEFE